MKHVLGRMLLVLLILTTALLAVACQSAAPAQISPTSRPTISSSAAPGEAAASQATGYPADRSAAAPSPESAYPAGMPTAARTEDASPTALSTLAPNTPFDADRAFRDLEYQMSLGPRTPGSDAHAQLIDWLQKELSANGWTVEIQETTRMGHPIRNVIAKRGAEDPSTKPWVIFGAHFDSRFQSDQDKDPANRETPVPAANDGASGVAVLLELSRILPQDLNQQVWLTFFDAEDQGELTDWDWLLGSRAVAESLVGKPDAVIVIDMIGDADLNIYKESTSNPELTDEIWNTAAQLGYTQSFIPETKWSMIDDHTPFLEKGIRAIDIIDFDYPYWHTTADTTDKVSAQSLKTVGDTLFTWLTQRAK